MTKKIILVCVALAAFAAFVLPATASASPRLCETSTGGGEPCTNVTVGSNVKGTNTGTWTFTGGENSGNVVCSSVTLTLTLRENNGISSRGDITSAAFGGTGTGGDCTGPLGTSVAVSTTEGNGLPWCLVANNEMGADEFQMRGNACANASRSITFKFNITGQNDCWYNKTTTVNGTFTTDLATGEDGVLTFGASNTWTLEKEEKTIIFAPACPSFVILDGTVTLETDVATVEPLYIK